MQPQTNASRVLVEIDIGSDQAGSLTTEIIHMWNNVLVHPLLKCMLINSTKWINTATKPHCNLQCWKQLQATTTN